MSQILPPLSMREILSKNLSIPNYQRPYKWKVKHVLNLITDVEHERTKNLPQDSGYKYRIGSVILHEDGNAVYIVDGQQRLLTIGLVLSVIAPKELEAISLFHKKFTNKTTLDNLSFNREQIDRFFKNWEKTERAAFATYLMDDCEMIVIKASNIAEAFQLFDSQNARGKLLEPADLLKAYHLRAMDDEHEKRMCVRRWEEAIDRELLYHVLSKIIYRCRRWMKRDYEAYDFSNEVIDEFKGADVNIFTNRNMVEPYLKRLYLTSQINNYSIDEPIANGKRFFDYVDHYVSIYEKLFPGIKDFQTNKSEQRLLRDNEKQHLIRTNCFYSPKMYRPGDRRLRNALYCLLVAYYDKYGDLGYNDFFKIAYQYVYQLRIELAQISQPSIRLHILASHGRGRWGNDMNPFEWIGESYHAYPSELRTLLHMSAPFTVDQLNSNVR